MLQILTREEGDQNAMRSDGGVRAVGVRVIPRDSVSKTQALHVPLRLSQEEKTTTGSVTEYNPTMSGDTNISTKVGESGLLTVASCFLRKLMCFSEVDEPGCQLCPSESNSVRGAGIQLSSYIFCLRTKGLGLTWVWSARRGRNEHKQSSA
ncbi:hypothetical protein RRG08_029221 [Elysia crispata]|uniref:Uncharacterized protein n=1 Tax=Elysia crispata TaxID=231223 RepID=A0AAE1ALA4_9GAST|nr:hypothetical protein RRG08_029221 [Elysia crispata]